MKYTVKSWDRKTEIRTAHKGSLALTEFYLLKSHTRENGGNQIITIKNGSSPQVKKTVKHCYRIYIRIAHY